MGCGRDILLLGEAAFISFIVYIYGVTWWTDEEGGRAYVGREFNSWPGEGVVKTVQN